MSLAATSPPPAQPLKAAGFMAGAMASFTLMAVAGRSLAPVHDTFEIMLWRSALGLIIVAAPSPAAAYTFGQNPSLSASGTNLFYMNSNENSITNGVQSEPFVIPSLQAEVAPSNGNDEQQAQYEPVPVQYDFEQNFSDVAEPFVDNPSRQSYERKGDDAYPTIEDITGDDNVVNQYNGFVTTARQIGINLLPNNRNAKEKPKEAQGFRLGTIDARPLH